MVAKFGVAVAVAGAVFFLDLLVPGGYSVGALYVLPLVLLLALRCDLSWGAPALGALSSVLVVVDVWLGAAGPNAQVTYTNRAFTLIAVVSTAVLIEVARRRGAQTVVARKQAATLFHAALEAAPDAMLVTDEHGVIRSVNAAAAAMFRYPSEELVGRPLTTVVQDRRGNDERERLHGLIDGPLGVPGPRQVGLLGPIVGVRKDRSEIALDSTVSEFVSGGEKLTIHASRDVTDRRKLEERLRATQRMEAIGRLAGGVAHDFNNVLAVIMSYARFAADAFAPNDPARADIDEVLAASERAAGLTKQLLAFSRRQVVKPIRFNPVGVLADMDKMLKRLIGEDIELVTAPPPEEGLIEIDPSQLEQVVLNLVINARDAMPKGGRITIELGCVTLDDAYAKTHPDVTTGDYVMLAVSDTGTGMTEDVRLRVFEPFFTTKGPGSGTGLGLATVYGIIKQANGHIWVYSEPGRGSTFKAYFPRQRGAAEPMPVQQAIPSPGGTETVLVVEDEAPLRNVAVRVLRKAGYAVLEAGNGMDAMRKVETGVQLDLLVTDVVMPMMGGRELAAKMRERDPNLAVLFMSGYTENAIVHHGRLESDVIFLQKPFQPDELLRRVRSVLDDAKQRG